MWVQLGQLGSTEGPIGNQLCCGSNVGPISSEGVPRSRSRRQVGAGLLLWHHSMRMGMERLGSEAELLSTRQSRSSLILLRRL